MPHQINVRNLVAVPLGVRRRRIAALCAAVSIISVSALAPGTASAETTRAQFIAEADPVCAEGNTVLIRLQGRLGRQYERLAIAAAMKTLASMKLTAAKMRRRLESLERPTADGPLLTRYFDLLRRTHQLYFRELEARLRFHFKQVARLTRRSSRVGNERVAVIAGYGFQACES